MKIEKIELDRTMELGKRTCLPFVVTSTCPKCGAEESRYLNNDYLSYPVIGENAINFYHPNADENETSCQTEWKESVVIGLTLTAVTP